MNDNSAFQDHEEFRIELYKSLRAEESSYLEKIPALWLQKFILIGVMLAFLLTRKEALNITGRGSGEELGFDAALVAIALLACFLDAKILEYSLHARAVSRFIEDEFTDVGVLVRWEKTLWGYGEEDSYARKLVRRRSATTVFVTAAPTAVVIVLVSIIIYIRSDVIAILVGGLIVSLAYIIATVAFQRSIWSSKAEVRETGQVRKSAGDA